jgi:pyruvate kinase
MKPPQARSRAKPPSVPEFPFNLAPSGTPARRRAKIICTIGPACHSEAAMRDLLRLGMDVARLNFSHGTHEDHARNIERLRRAAEKEDRTICILQDLQGPKIRTGRLERHEPVLLKSGSTVLITPRDITGTATRISTTFQDLAREVAPGARILLRDGLIELRVRTVRGKDVVCDVLNGGTLGEHQGINLPGTALSIPALTEKDRKDLEFGLKHGVDAVALSFVRTAADVNMVRQIVPAAWERRSIDRQAGKAAGHRPSRRNPGSLRWRDGCPRRSGRGNGAGKSSSHSEACDPPCRSVAQAGDHSHANARVDDRKPAPHARRSQRCGQRHLRRFSDSVMLSAETASGRYPREAVAMMSRIVIEAESNMGEFTLPRRRRDRHGLSVAETICESIAHAAEDLPMGAIAVFTETGNTARMISKYRPQAAIYAFTHNPTVAQRTNLYWGVHPMKCAQALSVRHMVRVAEKELLSRRSAQAGDVLGVVAGTRQASGSTNFMRLHVRSPPEEAGRGHAIYPQAHRARQKL